MGSTTFNIVEAQFINLLNFDIFVCAVQMDQ